MGARRFVTKLALTILVSNALQAQAGSDMPRECVAALVQSAEVFKGVSERMLSDQSFDQRLLNSASSTIDGYLDDVENCQSLIPEVLVINGENIFPQFSIDSIVRQFEGLKLYVEAFEEGVQIDDESLRHHMEDKFSRYSERALEKISGEVKELCLSDKIE